MYWGRRSKYCRNSSNSVSPIFSRYILPSFIDKYFENLWEPYSERDERESDYRF